MTIKRLATRVGVGAAAAAAIAAVSIAPANAAGTWAAIMYSPAAKAYGYAYNAGSKQEALDTAKNYCIQYGGTDCQMASVASTGCLALATSSSSWHGGLGPSKGAAEADALAENNGGTIAVSGCTGA